MIKENNQITINANQTEVFDFLTNDENLSQWVNGIVAIKPIGTHNNAVGDAVQIDFNIPKEGSVISTLTHWDRPVNFATAYIGDGMVGSMQYKLEPVDESTTAVSYFAATSKLGHEVDVTTDCFCYQKRAQERIATT